MIIQNIDFIPTPVIFRAMIAALSNVVFLFFLSHRPFKVMSEIKRIQISYLLSFLTWVCLLLSYISFDKLALPSIFDIITGSVLLLLADWFILNAWMFLVWGFRFNMLLSLDRLDQYVTKRDWISAYTNDQGLELFLEDRLGLAIRTRAAIREGEQIHLTPFGVFVGMIVKVGRSWFGFKERL